MTVARCPGCRHAVHRDGCRSKGPSRCGTVVNPGTGAVSGIACMDTRLPCACPFGLCHTCGAPIAGASPLPLGDLEVDVDRGSAGVPDGTVTVWKLADGTLACRRLVAGDVVGAGEWPGRVHVHQLPEAAAWLVAA